MENIISINEIYEIIRKYNIGKRPLSIILGFGEITITRYLDGYPITKQKSDVLKEVLDNPVVFLEYLEKNKDEISNIAYAKSKRKVEELLNTKFDNDDTIEIISEYIIKNNDETTNLSLQKILYYCQLFSYVIFNKPLFSSKCSAWEHGPIFSNIYYKYKSNGNELITTSSDITIDSKTNELVDEIIKDFGCYSGKVLCYFTHTEDTWKDAYQSTNTEISNNAFEELSKEIKEKYKINNIADISKYSEDLMNMFKERK